MEQRPPNGFRDPTTLTRWTRALLCASILAQVVGVGRHAQASRAIVETGEAPTSPELWIIRILLMCVGLVTWILVSSWIHRANYNVRELGAKGLKFTPGAAVGWYFVPVANLWMPYRAMKEIWRASVSPANWQKQALSMLVPGWWLLGIAGSSIAGFVTWGMQRGGQLLDERAAEHIGDGVAQGALIPVTLLFLVIVSRVHSMQVAHYRRQVATGKSPAG